MQKTADKAEGHDRNSLLALSLGTLGVVYGDIGTSPLYSLRECFHASHGVSVVEANVLGILSLIFWALTAIISVKYLVFVLRADNEGEGGTLALMTLLASGKRSGFVLGLGLIGTSLLFGECVITPAISVLSAVEGLGVVTHGLQRFVVPITVIVLIALFAIQRKGTGKVGAYFGPVMLLWFATLAVLGVRQIVEVPHVLAAVNPYWAFRFLHENGHVGFLTLGSVVLVITGGEALYADMGHFGRRPIRLTWYFAVMPSLLLNYFGQGALLLRDPSAASHPFYNLAPAELMLPFVALSTAATIIASQAVISGAFSLTRQAIQLGFSPRVFIRHTSAVQVGQIYVPSVNRMLMLGAIAVVLLFRSSSALASAYGVAVTGTMAITTVLLFVVTQKRWGWKITASVALLVVFLTIDLGLFSSTLVKFFSGGWLALSVAAIVFLLMATWRQGRIALGRLLSQGALSPDQFLSSLGTSKVARVPGTAIFLSRQDATVPSALLHNIKHNKVVHQTVILLTIRTAETARCTDDRVEVRELGHGVYRFTVKFGFMEDPDLPAVLRVMKPPPGVDLSNPSYFLSREVLVATKLPPLSPWRMKIFAAMLRNSTNASQFFRLPADRVVELGMQIT